MSMCRRKTIVPRQFFKLLGDHPRPFQYFEWKLRHRMRGNPKAQRRAMQWVYVAREKGEC